MLHDPVTGFCIALGPEESAALERLPFADEELIEALSALGLLDEGLSAGQIAERQRAARRASRQEDREEALAEALRFAGAEVPLYRERFAEAGLDPASVEAGELAALPLLEKSDIRASFPDRLLPAEVSVADLLAEGSVILGATSGTTDERLECLSDARVGSQPDDYPAFFGLDPEVRFERSASFTSPLCAGFECHLGYVPPEERTRGGLLALNSSDDIMSFSDDEVSGVVDELKQWSPQVLFVNPWYGAWLARRAAALGRALPRPAAVISTYQLLTRRHRKLLAEALQAPVFNSYSATELGDYTAASECARGSTHVREDHVHLELLDDEGRPLPPPTRASPRPPPGGWSSPRCAIA